MIELQQLTKRFGDSAVVKGLTFDVAEGTVLGFLGPNGAGKSTTMKMIAGFLGQVLAAPGFMVMMWSPNGNRLSRCWISPRGCSLLR